MKQAASHALADLVAPEELNAEYILPLAFDKRVGPAVAAAVAKAARDSGVARLCKPEHPKNEKENRIE